MAGIKHNFTSPKADGSDATVVRPSDWNAEHTIEDGALGSVKLDDLGTPDDNTDLDATTILHGLMSKSDKVKIDGVTALADVTADNAPKAHKASHQDTGGDEISLTGLSGDPADTINQSLLTTRGDILYRGASVAARLAKGTAGYYLKQGANDPEWAAQAGINLTVGETEVFNGNSPNSWTDLDLSGTIGAQASLVVLKIYVDNSLVTAVRKNGDTDEFYSTTTQNFGAAHGENVTGVHIVLVVATDAAGIIEWKTQSATANSTVDVIAYIA